jgi:zinc transporter, ZIP family
MMDYWQLLLLGAFSGLTIFLGLPLAVLPNVSRRKKGLLNALAIGILIFLIADVLGHAWAAASDAAVSAFAGKAPIGDASLDLFAMFGGLAVGLLGLVWYEGRFMRRSAFEAESQSPVTTKSTMQDGGTIQPQTILPMHGAYAYRLSTMIALGIGAHNFSEGLAIGQSYAAGSISLALLLIIGFGAHNTTEGFGIASPLTGLTKRPSARFLAWVGLIGGGPTFLGTVVGSLWSSAFTYILFLAMAGGALIYVSLLMYNTGRRQTTNNVLMLGIFLGLIAGFATDLIVTLGGA